MNTLTAVNRLLAPSGTGDTTINQGGTLLAAGTSLTLTSFPPNWPATGILRVLIYKVGDTNHEVIDIDLSTRSTLTFTIARATEEATALPACNHADGASIWVVATAAMIQGVAGVGYEDLATADTTLTPSNTFVDVTGVTHTLAPGVWDVRATAYFDYQGVGGGFGSISFKITDGTNDYFGGDSVISDGFVQTCSAFKRITLTATTTLKMQARAQTNNAHIRRYLQVPGGTIPATLLQCFPVGGSPSITEYIHLREEQAQNTQGGTFTSGAWRTRTLNTKSTDTGGIATLSSNQFTLPAGTYLIKATAPGYQCDRHQARLQNITDTSTTALSTTEFTASAGSATVSRALIYAEFTITAPKTFEIQHQCQTTKSSDGFGVAANFTTEVYSEVEIWRGAAITGGVFGGAGSGLVTLSDQRVLAQTAANAAVLTCAVGAQDRTFLVSGNINVTASTTHSFGMTCTYSDETNTSRTLQLTFCTLAGTLLTAITNVQGTGAYEGLPLQIRAKAGTTITFATTGTFTSVTYNAEGTIVQVA